MSPHIPRILIAEDDPALLRVLSYKLDRTGFQVTEASDGEAAWEYTQSRQFDLVITDNCMPGMTGAELCEKLAKQDQYSDVPLVMLTGKGMEADLKQLHRQLGLAASFVKPFSPRMIIETVEELLETTGAPVT